MLAESAAPIGHDVTLLDILQCPRSPRLYVHDYAAADVPSLPSARGAMARCFAERALVMAQQRDVVVVADPVDADYLGYLESLQIGPRADRVVALSREPVADLTVALAQDAAALDRVAALMCATPGRWHLSPYLASRATCGVRETLSARLRRPVGLDGGALDAVVASNRKDVVRRIALRRGVTVPPGEVVRGGGCATAAAVVARHLSHTGSVFVRGAWSMGGADTLVLHDDAARGAALADWLAARRHLTTFVVESLIPIAASPNVQAWVGAGGRVHVLDVTEQRLDRKLKHHGNAFERGAAHLEGLVESTHRLASWLAGLGYRGPLGVDFIVDARAVGGPRCLLAEVNGRINGAHYASALAARIDQARRSVGARCFDAWVSSARLPTSVRRFDHLEHRLGDLLYRHHRQAAGVVPFNTGLLGHGAFDCLILGASVGEALEIERAAVARLAAQ